MKVLVTGAAGFIGGQLWHTLWKRGDEVVGIDNFSYGSMDNLKFDDHDFGGEVRKMDIRDKAGMLALFEAEKFDVVYNIAGIAPLPDCQSDPVQAIEVNTLGLVNLLDMERSGKASQHYDLQLYGAADEIVPKLIKGELDMAAIPANLAATLYQKTNGGIQVMAVNTLGVLYVVEKGDSVHSFADLKGRTILSTGKGTTPEYVLRYLLTKNGLDPDKDVKIEYYSEASEVTAQMAASKKDAIAVLPQPYVTAAQLKDSSLRVVLDLTKEWNKVCDTQLITGVTVVRTEYAKENPDIVANFLRDYEKSIKAAQTDIAGTAALCEETGVVAKKAIAQKALPQCNIVYRVGDEMKADVNAYLKVLYDASPAAVGGKLPDANFYYTKATPGQVFWKSVQRSFQ